MGEIQENWVPQQNGQNPHFKYHCQLKTRGVEGGGLRLQRGGQQFT